jgi:hypothetical protein
MIAIMFAMDGAFVDPAGTPENRGKGKFKLQRPDSVPGKRDHKEEAVLSCFVLLASPAGFEPALSP